MSKFTQHVPNYCSGIDPCTFDFKTIDNLLNNDIIKRQIDIKENRDIFILSERIRYHKDRTWGHNLFNLMIRNKKYDWWWVIGSLDVDDNMVDEFNEYFNDEIFSERIKK